MLDILSIATQKVTAILIAPVIGVFGTLFQFQYEAPVANQAPIQIFQTQVFPVPASIEEIATSSAKAGIRASSSVKFSLPAVKLKAVTAPQPKKTQKTEIFQPKPATAISPAPKISTPQDALNATSFSLNQRTDGQYVLTFHMNTGIGSGLDWGFYEETIGGISSVPKMGTTYSCNPQWNAPPSNSSDQNPTFDLNTSYTCDISMTDSLLRTATKKITFQTGMGRLLVKSSNLSTLLKSGLNSNGFVFDNQSNTKLIINGLTFDIYFKALNVSSPIVVRFINPDDETSHIDFQVQNLPADVANPNVRSTTGMKTSFSFSINPRSQRLLRAELLGIQQLLTIGVNPEFNVILQQVNVDSSDIKTVFFSPAISWNCIPFDPAKSLSGIPSEQNCK